MKIRTILSVILILSAVPSKAQVCKADIPDAAGYRILRVISSVRWGQALAADSPVRPGDPYNQANVERTKVYVQDQLDRQDDVSLNFFSRFSATYIQPCTVLETAAICNQAMHVDKCVTIDVQVKALRIPAAEPIGPLLNKSKSSTDTYLGGVPRPLLATSPQFDLDSDAALGTALKFHSSTDLALLSALLQSKSIANQSGDARYNSVLTLDGSRSLDAPYYLAAAGLHASRRLNASLKELSTNLAYSAAATPMGEGSLRANTLLAGLSAQFTPGIPFLQSLLVGASYNHFANSLTDPRLSSGYSEDGLLAQVSADGFFKAAPLKTSLWYQHNSVSSASTYDKFVVRSAFQNSFPIKPHQTLDVELLGGYGRVSGQIPLQDHFVGGNSGANFLYETSSSVGQAQTPPGPVLRSFGAGKLDWAQASSAVTRQSFYHFNATVSIPIGLSRPLIPEFDVFANVTVSQVLKAQVDKNNILKQILIRRGATPAAAQKEQDRTFKTIRPAVHFIADQANIWSIKPLLLFDYAHTDSEPRISSNTSWPAVGGGVQLAVVTARLEAGYMHSLEHKSGPDPGNFILRLTFQNLF